MFLHYEQHLLHLHQVNYYIVKIVKTYLNPYIRIGRFLIHNCGKVRALVCELYENCWVKQTSIVEIREKLSPTMHYNAQINSHRSQIEIYIKYTGKKRQKSSINMQSYQQYTFTPTIITTRFI